MNRVKIISITGAIALAFVWNSCSKAPSNTTTSGLVNQSINIINYPALNVVTGSLYISPAQGAAGVHGVIVYRASQTQFYAYEATCTYTGIPYCEPLVVVKTFYAEDTCKGCKSTFSLPGGGAVVTNPATIPLHQYTAAFDGLNTVTITN
jgi:Rieske Fe-S protein